MHLYVNPIDKDGGFVNVHRNGVFLATIVFYDAKQSRRWNKPMGLGMIWRPYTHAHQPAYIK